MEITDSLRKITTALLEEELEEQMMRMEAEEEEVRQVIVGYYLDFFVKN